MLKRCIRCGVTMLLNVLSPFDVASSQWEVEKMIKPKLKDSSPNDTITAESPECLPEVFIEIARKHNLDEKEAHQILYELLSALKEPAFIAQRSFDEMLEYIQ